MPTLLSQSKEIPDPALFSSTTTPICEITKAERQIRTTLTKTLLYTAEPEKFTEFKMDALEVIEIS
jgi:hypothetical protein